MTDKNGHNRLEIINKKKHIKLDKKHTEISEKSYHI